MPTSINSVQVKKIKIVLSVLFVLLLVFSYFIFMYEKPVIDKEVVKVDLVQVEADYKIETKNFVNNFSEIIKREDFVVDDIKILRDGLLDLKVPAEFKELHLDLVMAIIKMENFLENNYLEDGVASQEIIKKSLESYPWLNN